MIEKVMEKKELHNLPREDVEMAFSFCDKPDTRDSEKIRCTRELLHKVYGAFGSRKLLINKEHEPEWILRKHLSSRERLPYYKKLYDRLLKGNETIIDLGAGVNGFSLNYLPKTKYLAVEAIGQLVSLMNNYFKKERLNSKAFHFSLFNIKKVKELIRMGKTKRVVFLFKVLDSLEILVRDYSKRLLLEIVPMVDRVVVSFATRSMIARKLFRARRNWIVDFIKENFEVIDDFELGGERYVVFREK